MSLIFQKIQIPASQRNYSWSRVHLETQPLRHSGLLLRSEVLAKVLISLSDYYSEAAKGACPTIWNSMDPCWLESRAGRWKQPSLAINTFLSLQTFRECSEGNAWLFAQAHTASRWACSTTHEHHPSQNSHRLWCDLPELSYTFTT